MTLMLRYVSDTALQGASATVVVRHLISIMVYSSTGKNATYAPLWPVDCSGVGVSACWNNGTFLFSFELTILSCSVRRRRNQRFRGKVLAID